MKKYKFNTSESASYLSLEITVFINLVRDYKIPYLMSHPHLGSKLFALDDLNNVIKSGILINVLSDHYK